MPSPKFPAPPKPADLTPRQFLRRERRLFCKLTPAWRDSVIAGRGAAPEPEPPKPRPVNISEATARRVLKLLLKQYQPGDDVGYRQVQEVTQYSVSHSQGVMHRLKKMRLWPFRLSPFKRKESQHARPESQAK